MMTKRAAVYSRVSTAEQAEDDKASLNEQERRCREFCQEKGYDVTASYQDIGSGTTRKRPSFTDMLKDASLRQFDVIIAWKTDRLARGIYPCAALMEAIEDTDVTIETVAELFDRTTFEIRAVVGRMELENIAQRTQMGREGSIKAGHHPPQPPYGYDYDPTAKRWRVNEAEAQWVRQIFVWYIEGVSTYDIARRLNLASVSTKHRSKNGWLVTAVSALVNAEVYTGVTYFNKRQKRSRKSDRASWLPMDVPPIITKEMWEAAQTKRKSNKKWSPRNTQKAYLTQGVLFCQECGYPFHIISGTGRSVRLVCVGMRLFPHIYHCRPNKTMTEQPLAHRLWEAVAGVVGSEAGLEAAIRSRVEYVAKERDEIEKRRRELGNKRADLKLEQDRVISWARKGHISEDQLNRQLRAIQAEDEQYATEEDGLSADLRLQEDAETVYQLATQLIPGMRDRLNNGLAENEKRDLIRLLIRRAVIDKDGNMTIELRVPAPELSFDYGIRRHTT